MSVAVTAGTGNVGDGLAAPPDYRRLASGGALLLSARVVCVAMGLGVNVLVARALPVRAYGALVVAFALQQFAVIFVDGGITNVVLRETSRMPEIEHDLIRRAVIARAALTGVFSAVLALVGLLIVSGTDQRIAVALILLTAPLSAWTVRLTVLQRQAHLYRLAILLVLQSGAWLAVATVLVLAGSGLVAICAGYVVATAVFVAGVRFMARPDHEGARLTVDWAAFVRLTKDALPIGVTALTVQAYVRLDAFFVYRLAGAHDAGVYGLATRILEQATVVPVTLSAIFFPILSRAPSRQASADVIRHYASASAILGVAIIVPAYLVAAPVVKVLFGETYSGATPVLKILLPGFLAVALGWVVAQAAITCGRTRARLVVSCVALAFNLAANALAVPIYGARGAAVTTVATEALVVILLYTTIRSQVPIRISLSWIARFALAACVSAGIAASLTTVFAPVAVPAFFCVYIFMLWLSGVLPLSAIRGGVDRLRDRGGTARTVRAHELR